jgi:predicted protein tyrosine phosphatase
MNILAVCGKGKKRSKTAEFLFRNNNEIRVRAVGLSENSLRKVTINDIEWAEVILVMEQKHKSRLVGLFTGAKFSRIEVAEIEDRYEYMDPELCEILLKKIEGLITI